MKPTGDITPEVRAEYMARNWASPTYAAMSVAFVDALLARVWQGKRPGLRDHMLDVCAQVSRRFDKPWMDDQLAAAWDEGFMNAASQDHPSYPRTRRIDNPYTPNPSPAATQT